jgi:hypothetical protein
MVQNDREQAGNRQAVYQEQGGPVWCNAIHLEASVWQNRHVAVGMLDGFYLSAKQNGESNSSPCRIIKNDCKLVKYVALDDIYQLRGCYLTTKINLSVFVEPDQAAEMAAIIVEANKLNETLYCFTLKPKFYVDAINCETTRNKDGHFIGPCGAASQITANSYFSNITNLLQNNMQMQPRGVSIWSSAHV